MFKRSKKPVEVRTPASASQYADFWEDHIFQLELKVQDAKGTQTDKDDAARSLADVKEAFEEVKRLWVIIDTKDPFAVLGAVSRVDKTAVPTGSIDTQLKEASATVLVAAIKKKIEGSRNLSDAGSGLLGMYKAYMDRFYQGGRDIHTITGARRQDVLLF